MSDKVPTRFIAVQEFASGNASIGTEWLRAATFPPHATLLDVWAWQRQVEHESISRGRLMLTGDSNV